MARVLLVGDSMAEGLERPLRSLLASQGHTLLDDWHRGDLTSEWVSIARPSIRNHSADIVLVALGTNDAFNRVSPAQTARNAAAIVQRAEGRPVLWLLPPNSSRVNANATNEAIKSTGVAYVDARSLGLQFYDGVHPTPASFATWASAIAGRIATARSASGSTSASVSVKKKTKPSNNVEAVPLILLVLLALKLLRG